MNETVSYILLYALIGVFAVKIGVMCWIFKQRTARWKKYQ